MLSGNVTYLFQTEDRPVPGVVNARYRNVVQKERDGQYCVLQQDIEDGHVCSTTPVRSFDFLDEAIAFAKV
jgi:hypothetical protein